VGGCAANAAVSEFADRPPTPDPSPPRADARGGRGEGGLNAPPLHRIRMSNSHVKIEFVIASEAKQSILSSLLLYGLLRRFAPRNDERHTFAFPRRVSPGLCIDIVPRKTEGAGNAGCRSHPWALCNKKAQG
jgi:hypothetical protein